MSASYSYKGIAVSQQAGKVVFIINPFSALGQTKTRFEHSRASAHQFFPHMQVLETTHPNHATQLTRTAIEEGAHTVVAVGGDGTFNEVLNGFFKPDGSLLNPHTRMALIQSGTGADFCRTLHRKISFEADFKRIQNGRISWVDVGKATVTGTDGLDHIRFFLNVASLGLSAQTAQLLEKQKKSHKMAYFWTALKALIGFHPQTIRLIADKEPIVYPDLSLLAIANGQYFGGGMQIAPGARIDDGYFEQVAVCNMGVFFFLRHGLKVYKGQHVHLPQVSAQRSRVVKVEAPKEPVPIELDGEPFGCLPARFEMLTKAIPLVI